MFFWGVSSREPTIHIRHKTPITQTPSDAAAAVAAGGEDAHAQALEVRHGHQASQDISKSVLHSLISTLATGLCWPGAGRDQWPHLYLGRGGTGGSLGPPSLGPPCPLRIPLRTPEIMATEGGGDIMEEVSWLGIVYTSVLDHHNITNFLKIVSMIWEKPYFLYWSST